MLISQSAAAKIAGVSRQAINNIKKSGTYNFFEGKKINTESQDWKSYLVERESNDAQAEKPVLKKDKTKLDNTKKQKKKIVRQLKPSESQKHALTGGFDPKTYKPQNIADVKRLAEIQKLNIEMRVRLGELVERRLVDSFFSTLSNSIQSNFVDLPRKVSVKICKHLDCVGMEKEVEKILSEPIAKGIQNIKNISLKSMKVKEVS